MRRYRTSVSVFNRKGESNFGDSLTIPDQAPTMRELLVRHAQGITDNVAQQLSFSGDLPDLRGVEPHDLSLMLYEQQERVKQLQSMREKQEVELQQARLDAKRKRDLELLKELQSKEQ